MVILITGKKNAGKTTYANRLAKELNEIGIKVTIIDGDQWRLREKNQDFTDKGRRRNLISAAQYAAKLEKDGHIVIMSFIAPKSIWRNEMRGLWYKSRIVYIPGGTLWKGTEYEIPNEKEFQVWEKI